MGSIGGSVATSRPEPVTADAVHQGAVQKDLSFEELGRIIVEKVPDPKSGGDPVNVFGEVERAIVGAALDRTGGNKQAAANLLGVYRPRLYSMIKKHNLTNNT